MELFLALATFIVGAGSAIYTASQQSKANRSAQKQSNLTSGYNRASNTYDYRQSQLDTNYALAVNDADILETNALLESYGLQSQLYDAMSVYAAQRYGLEQSLIDWTADIVGKKYAAEKEIYEWQLATLDWQAGFKESQAEMLDTQGALSRELYGVETAKLIAKQRARMAASGLEMGEGSPVEVLGSLAGERQFESDVVKYDTDVAIFNKKFEAASLLNDKNNVRAAQFISGLDYLGDMGNLAYRAGGAAIDYNASMTELGYKKGLLDIQGDVTESKLGLLQTKRNTILAGADINLGKYNLAQTYGQQSSGIQNSIYNTTQNSIYVGAGFNIGAAAFNATNNYYTMTKKAGA